MIQLCDVTLRDGIQILKNFPSTIEKIKILDKLIDSGIKNIEIGSNVSKKVEPVKDIHEILSFLKKNEYHKKGFRVLVPNKEKMVELLPYYNSKIFDIYSLITASSDTFSMKNTRMNVKQSIDEINKILFAHEGYCKYTHKHPNYRIYISTCFGCPYEGNTNKEHLANIQKIIEKFQFIPQVKEIVISDTIGNYNLPTLEEILTYVERKDKLWLHLHLLPENMEKVIKECISLGIYNYDVSLGNLGGCSSVKEKKLCPNVNTYDICNIFNLKYDKAILQELNKKMFEYK